MRHDPLVATSALTMSLGGLGAIATLGGPSPWIAFGAAIGTMLGLYLRPRWRHAGLMSLAAFTLPAALWTFEVLPLAHALATVLAGLLLTTALGERAPTTSAILTASMIALAATHSPTLPVGIAAIVWCMATPSTLALHQLHRSPDRSGSESLALVVGFGTGVLGITLAAVLPRPPNPSPVVPTLQVPSAQRTVGLASSGDLGALAPLLDDPTPALRVFADPDGVDPPLLRGAIYDHFDGTRWRSTASLDQPQTHRPASARATRIEQRPGAGEVIFGPGALVAVDGLSPEALPDTAGVWHAPARTQTMSYTVWTVPLELLEPQSPDSALLQLPELDPQISELAHELLGDLDGARQPLVAAQRVERWLAQNTRHTLSLRPSKDPIADFLLDHREGHCELHATAAALLLRGAGVPTRMVHGYAPEPRRQGEGVLTVRRGNAHAWLEVLDATGRWHPIDPTPGGPLRPAPPTRLAQIGHEIEGAFDRGVLGYDHDAQRRVADHMLSLAGRVLAFGSPAGLLALGLGAVAILLGALLRWLSGRTLGRQGPIARTHTRARQVLARAGLEPPASLPPLDAAGWIAERHATAGAALRELAWLHYQVRYGGAEEAPLIPDARDLLRKVRRAARHTERDKARGPKAALVG
ncbi:MAG: DUF3488 domain-containing protein [Deltaproteobacteria bacterium]|nr:MAG: DUF3488 domain-containing protein [Deltaproteobacteria bacterium]